MTYLLDTNICIYLIKQHSRELLKKIQRHFMHFDRDFDAIATYTELKIARSF